MQAWARLCKCLGKDFLPYMGVVMPPLLQSAQLKPDVIISSADSDADIDDEDDRYDMVTSQYCVRNIFLLYTSRICIYCRERCRIISFNFKVISAHSIHFTDRLANLTINL